MLLTFHMKIRAMVSQKIMNAMAYLGKTREQVMYFNANHSTIEFAKGLRKSMTDCEKKIWTKLRRKRVHGIRFRRQQPINLYVADFYCHELRLVIEIDGLVHEEPERVEHDMNRDALMNHFGITVLRFTNDDIQNRLGWVIERINQVIERLKLSPLR